MKILRAELPVTITVPLNAKHRLILILVYGCGLRLRDVCLIKHEDIDFDQKIMWIRKAKGKKVMLDEALFPYLLAWCKDYMGVRYLFEGYRPGIHLSRHTVEKIYTDTCNRKGVDPQGGIHSLRHSFATHLLEQGVDKTADKQMQVNMDVLRAGYFHR